MATLYNAIGANKRKTWLLVIIFSLFTVFIVLFLGLYLGLDATSSLILGTMFATFYSLISFYLADKAVLTIAGAKQVTKTEAPDLYRLVENLSITAGMPTPKIYIINDVAPNAFATGRDPKNASIAFTTGILSLMNEQEIEGVIAHELSHIKNFDIRLMTIVVVLVGLIMLTSDLILHLGTGKKDSKNNNAIFLIIGLVLALLSPLIAQVIKLSISRTREYLADHSGALLTRYPPGLISALSKLRDQGSPLKRANHATAHLYLANPFGADKKLEPSWLARMFLTHPPLTERIKKLEEINQ